MRIDRTFYETPGEAKTAAVAFAREMFHADVGKVDYKVGSCVQYTTWPAGTTPEEEENVWMNGRWLEPRPIKYVYINNEPDGCGLG